MTDAQYKGMLLDRLQQWKEVLRMARNAGAQEIIDKANEQIELTS